MLGYLRECARNRIDVGPRNERAFLCHSGMLKLLVSIFHDLGRLGLFVLIGLVLVSHSFRSADFKAIQYF